MLEAAASSIFFPCENWVRFWKEYFLKIIVYKVETSSFGSKYASSAKWKKHVYLSKKPSVLHAGACRILIPCEYGVRFSIQCFLLPNYFEMEIVAPCSKYRFSAELKKPMYLSKENHLCQKLQHLAYCSPGRIAWVFERNPACTEVFQGGLRCSFLQRELFSWVEETHVSL